MPFQTSGKNDQARARVGLGVENLGKATWLEQIHVLIPRLLGFVFLAILGAVALSRCAVFTTLAYLVFER
jgi:hypothetical protein